MSIPLIGAGGWGYFPGGLRTYGRAFPFVEANVTFYRRIDEARAQRWRAQVPADFSFAVKVHRDVTHRSRMRATPAAQAAFADALAVARALRASIVVLEAPASVPFDRDACETLRDYASLLDGGLRLAVEARAHAKGPLPPAFSEALAETGCLEVVDPSLQGPRTPGPVYARVFGPGEGNAWQFDDRELTALGRTGERAQVAAYAFHGVRMYTDAARFLAFRRTGAFPPATSSVGVGSLDEVLRPDARFPAPRGALVRDHGWKVFDVDRRTRAHVRTTLERLPDRTYESLDALLLEAAPLLRTSYEPPESVSTGG